MDERSCSLILRSLGKLFPATELVDAMFAARLLNRHPDVYRVFATGIEPQETRLVHTLRLVLGEFRRFGAILPTVRGLARSHKVCRLIDNHYEALGETLIWTLRLCLGAGFSAETERAWHEALHASPGCHFDACGGPELRHLPL
ncbi:hypothetical protein [Hyphomicrobium sp. 2TAF46]|uniref:hypothetical protein n=1 Tax=Hyphomicrobium sp. 2TAF46 TaxID=3233019 RepID=UPI003F933BEE